MFIRVKGSRSKGLKGKGKVERQARSLPACVKFYGDLYSGMLGHERERERER